jgi:hypothetical protein
MEKVEAMVLTKHGIKRAPPMSLSNPANGVSADDKAALKKPVSASKPAN